MGTIFILVSKFKSITILKCISRKTEIYNGVNHSCNFYFQFIRIENFILNIISCHCFNEKIGFQHFVLYAFEISIIILLPIICND